MASIGDHQKMEPAQINWDGGVLHGGVPGKFQTSVVPDTIHSNFNSKMAPRTTSSRPSKSKFDSQWEDSSSESNSSDLSGSEAVEARRIISALAKGPGSGHSPADATPQLPVPAVHDQHSSTSPSPVQIMEKPGSPLMVKLSHPSESTNSDTWSSPSSVTDFSSSDSEGEDEGQNSNKSTKKSVSISPDRSVIFYGRNSPPKERVQEYKIHAEPGPDASGSKSKQMEVRQADIRQASPSYGCCLTSSSASSPSCNSSSGLSDDTSRTSSYCSTSQSSSNSCSPQHSSYNSSQCSSYSSPQRSSYSSSQCSSGSDYDKCGGGKASHGCSPPRSPKSCHKKKDDGCKKDYWCGTEDDECKKKDKCEKKDYGCKKKSSKCDSDALEEMSSEGQSECQRWNGMVIAIILIIIIIVILGFILYYLHRRSRMTETDGGAVGIGMVGDVAGVMTGTGSVGSSVSASGGEGGILPEGVPGASEIFGPKSLWSRPMTGSLGVSNVV